MKNWWAFANATKYHICIENYFSIVAKLYFLLSAKTPNLNTFVQSDCFDCLIA